MTTLTISGNRSADFLKFKVDSLVIGNVENATSNSVTISLPNDFKVIFSGSNLAYGAGGFTSGLITGWEMQYNNSPYYQISGFNITSTQFNEYVLQAKNTQGGLDNIIVDIFSGDSTVQGGGKDDGLFTGTGHDVVFGGAGSDTVFSGAGNDHIYGQSASGGSDGNDLVIAEGGSDYIQGNAGFDTLNGGEGSDRINGGADGDVIYGEGGNDTANGNRGNDHIEGGEGNDSIRGGQDDDYLFGDEGNDIISGDLGADELSGGFGQDIFLFSGSAALIPAFGKTDIINDFDHGLDHISLSFNVQAYLTAANTADLTAGKIAAQAVIDEHIGNGEVVGLSIGTDTYLFYASDGGSLIDSAIKVLDQTPNSFSASDFIGA